MRGPWSLFLVLPSLLIGGGGTPAAAAPPPTYATSASLNWSGYVLSGPRGSIHGVQGSWLVQRVHPEPNDTYSSEWVGVDGFSGGGLLQVGTDSDSLGHVPTYRAWVELAQTSALRLSMTVRPDDVMAATMLERGSDLWTITLADVTRRERFAATVRFQASGTSAEWIEERPVIVSSGIGSLANLSYFRVAKFGRRYTGSLPDSADVRRSIGGNATTMLRSVQMLLTSGPAHLVALDRVSALDRDGASFTVIRSKPFSTRGTPTDPVTTEHTPALTSSIADCIFAPSISS